MKFCDDHWAALRSAIDERGVSPLVAGDGAQAAQRFAQAMGAKRDTLSNFDPLMWCHWAIVGRIVEVSPDVLFVDGCPLCYARDQHDRNCPGPPACTITSQWFEDWIAGVADAASKRLERLISAESGPAVA